MNMRINTGSCAAACLKEEISHRHNSQAQRQGATMCLQNPIYQGVPEVGSEQGYWENLCIDDLSQHQKRYSCWGLEGPRTSPRDCVFPTCQSAELASVFASVLASTAFPLWHQGTVTFQPVSGWQARDFKGPLFCKTKGYMELLRDYVSGFAANICTLSFPRGGLPLSQQSLVARQSCNTIESLRGDISPRPLHKLQWPSAVSQHRLYCFILSEKMA